jgi:acyl carrier protein
MEREQIAERVKAAIVSVLKHDNFIMTDDLRAEDVDGWDSLSHMVIITEVENAFDVRFKLKELNKLQNMGDLIFLVQSKL